MRRCFSDAAEGVFVDIFVRLAVAELGAVDDEIEIVIEPFSLQEFSWPIGEEEVGDHADLFAAVPMCEHFLDAGGGSELLWDIR